MFRLVTSQLIESGGCRQADIIRTFGISKSSVIRGVKKLREQGPEAFFVKHRARRGGKVFNADVLEQAQRLLDQGYSRSDAAMELGIKYDTFRKAINDGRLVESSQPQAAISKSSRSMIDAAAADEMGVGCTRVGERVLASLGKLVGAEVSFETCLDVPKAGVLCALPAFSCQRAV
jgi:transposase